MGDISDDDSAALSTVTARSALPENGSERLKRFRWPKGQSGNPGGRPKRLPISDELREIIGMPLPEVLRRKLEAAIKQSLPTKMTFGEGLAFSTCLEALGVGVGLKLAIARDIRVAIEGRPARRFSVPE